MITDSVARLASLVGTTETRRSTLGALLGIALLGSQVGIARARPQPDGRGRSRGKHRGLARGKGKPKAGNHCITPAGRDLNEFYGITAQIVAPFCNQVGSGERWVNAIGWTMAHAFDVVPTGFASAWATPLEDFVAKFAAVKYVIDPGTRRERTVVLRNGDDLFVGEDEGLVLVSAGTLGTVHPLPVGEHTADVYWVFNETHCDGLGDVFEENCFPAGETLNVGLAFEVTPGHF
jgi:hypothetical protein